MQKSFPSELYRLSLNTKWTVMEGEKNFCYGKMTSSQRMSKAWKPFLRKQAVRHRRCQSKLVKYMPREWKTKPRLTESGRVLISHTWEQKVADGWPERFYIISQNKWRRFPPYKCWHWVEICTATTRESMLQASVCLPSQQCDRVLNIKLFQGYENVFPKCTSCQNTKRFLNRTGTGKMAW